MQGEEQCREGGNGGRGNDGRRGNNGGRGRGMVWWREGEHWSSLTWARRRNSFRRRPWGIVVMGGHRRCLLVGHHPRALEGCARGGACRPSWFERGGGRSRGWGVVAARGRLSFMGPSVAGPSLWWAGCVRGLSVCACRRCWWWRSSPVVAVEQWWVVAAVRGGGGRQPVMVVVERWPSSLGDGGGDCR